MRITRLFWDDDNIAHLWAAHQVTPTEVEEIIFGIDGEPPEYRIVREGANYRIFGRTGGGRLLYIIGVLIGTGTLRVFGARDMSATEKRLFRNR